MAGLSITRRRKAWLKGVAYGATGKGKCLLSLAKLKDIYQRGVAHGRANLDTPYVRAIVEQEQRRRPEAKPVNRRASFSSRARAQGSAGPMRRRPPMRDFR